VKKKNKRIHKFGGTLANSYERCLKSNIDKFKLLGAKLEVKEYRKRIPAPMQAAYEMTGKEMSDDDLMLVVVMSGKKIIAHTMLEVAFYYHSIKNAGSQEGGLTNDYMVEHVDSTFLRHIQEAMNDSKRNR